MKSTRQIKRFGVVMVVALVAIGALAGSALAAGGDATINGDELSAAVGFAPGTFTGTLAGDAQTLEAENFTDFEVTDPRGTGAGWTVTVAASQFEIKTALDPNLGKKLATSSLKMPVYAAADADPGDTSSTLPHINAAAYVAIDTGSPVQVSHTNATGDGMGSYAFSIVDDEPWTLDVPASAYEGVYSSTITMTVATL